MREKINENKPLDSIEDFSSMSEFNGSFSSLLDSHLLETIDEDVARQFEKAGRF